MNYFLCCLCFALFGACSRGVQKQPVLLFSGHEGIVRALDVSLDGTMIVSGGGQAKSKDHDQSGDMILWNARTGEKLQTYTGIGAIISAACFLPDSNSILALEVFNPYPDEGCYSSFMIFDIDKKSPLRTVAVFDNQIIHSFSVSPNGDEFVHNRFIPDDYHIGIYSIKTGELVQKLEGKVNQYVNAVTYFSGGDFIAAGDGSGLVILWNAVNGKRIWTIQTESDIESITFGQDNSTLLVSGNDLVEHTYTIKGAGAPEIVKFAFFEGGLALINVETPAIIFTIEGGFDEMFSDAVLTHDGSGVLSASTKGVKLWDPGTGRILAEFNGHSSVVNTLVLATEGTRFYTAAHDGNVIAWDYSLYESAR